MAHQSGPLPTDPVMGGDARTRAQTRQEWQQRVEHGFMGTQPMTPHQAMEWINQSQAQGRALVLDRLQEQLQQLGMSPEGAAAATEAMSRGIVPKEFVDFAQHGSKVLSGEEQGFNRYGQGLITTGEHWKPHVPQFNAADVAHLEKISKVTGGVGTALDPAGGVYEIKHRGSPPEGAAEGGGGGAGGGGGGDARAGGGSLP